MIKLSFYVPESHLELVKNALFQAGAGRVGLYEHCAWQTLGRGQFRPMAGSQPFIGSSGELETVAEYLVEMVCQDELIKPVIVALKSSHPYEEPAYSLYQLLDIDP